VSVKEVFVKYVVTEDDFVLVNEAHPKFPKPNIYIYIYINIYTYIYIYIYYIYIILYIYIIG